MNRFRLPGAVFAALAAGGGDAAGVRRLVDGQRSRTLALIREVVRSAGVVGHPGAAAAVAGYRALAGLPADTVDRPDVRAWALRTARQLAGPDPLRADPGWLALVREPVGSPLVDVVCGGVRLRVPLDPLDQPWTAGGPPRLPLLRGADLASWRRGVAAGWARLVERHPRTAREVGAGLGTITPLADPGGGRISFSFREAVGGIAFSLPPEPLDVALTLAHEIQHVKLSALMGLFPLVTPGPDVRYPVPWRPDPRPIDAVLHGAYAHLGVAEFWHREGRPADAARWRTAVTAAAGVALASNRLTPLGERFASALVKT